MATGRKQVGAGQTIASAWGNLVWDQSVQTFASAADRDTQFPTAALHPGAVVWLDDLKQLQVWTGTAWRASGGDMSVQGTVLAGAVFDPAKHRQHTFLFHVSVSTNQFGQVNVPLTGPAFLGYQSAHIAPNNRAWFGSIDFGNPPSLTALMLVMRDTTGNAAVNQSVDVSVSVFGWK